MAFFWRSSGGDLPPEALLAANPLDPMIPFLIYLCVPAIGIALYVRARRRIPSASVKVPLELGLFLGFACYGALLVFLLTGLFWEWSGMAALGSIGMMGGAVLLLAQAAWLHSRREESSFHDRLWWAAMGFLPAVLVGAAVLALRYRT